MRVVEGSCSAEGQWPTTYTIEITGDTKKTDAIINLLRPLGIKDLVRTGRIAISREEAKAAVQEKKKLTA